MPKALLILFLALPTLLSAQRRPPVVTFTKTTVGKNLLTRQPILAKEYSFGTEIYETAVDTQLQLATIKLRGLSKNGKWLKNGGDFILYDLQQKKINWSKWMMYGATHIEKLDKYILEIRDDKSHRLDLETGRRTWSTKHKIYMVDQDLDIGIGYKFSNWSGPTDWLEGIDLQTGEEIWRRDIERDYGWNDAFYLDDSTMIIVASGLHSLNLKTGGGWDYETLTGKKNYTPTAVGIMTGAVLGALTGAFLMPVDPLIARDVASNALLHENHMYFASKQQLAKLSTTGEVIWAKPLSDASKSYIYASNGRIYMVNYGYAFMGARQVRFGKPFIAAFDSETGKEIFTHVFEKGNIIRDFKLQNNILSLVFHDAVMTFSTDNGKVLAERLLEDEGHRVLSGFANQRVFVSNGEVYGSLYADDTKHFVFTEAHELLVLNDRLEQVETSDTSLIWFCYAAVDGKRFLARGDSTAVINEDDRLIAEFEASAASYIIGSSLYNSNRETFSEIDISSILAY